MIKKIYKFGGASVKDASAVRNLADIVSRHKNEDIMLVVSAMGKTTNALEKALADFREHEGRLGMDALHEVITYHDGIIQALFDGHTDPRFDENIASLFIELWEKLQRTDLPYDYQYDQTVSYGELISSTIIQEYLNHCEIPCRWLDARKYVLTDDRFRAASPNWDETRLRISKLNDEHIHGIVCITQGFIGATVDGKHSVTLGREGSDYTAAIFANCLDAEEVTIWKDVDGLLNADPKRFDQTVQLPHITYSEAIELAFYGFHHPPQDHQAAAKQEHHPQGTVVPQPRPSAYHHRWPARSEHREDPVVYRQGQPDVGFHFTPRLFVHERAQLAAHLRRLRRVEHPRQCGSDLGFDAFVLFRLR